MACVAPRGGRGRCDDSRACSTGVPGYGHRGRHCCVSTDRHASGRYRSAGGMVFPTAESVIDAGPRAQPMPPTWRRTRRRLEPGYRGITTGVRLICE